MKSRVSDEIKLVDHLRAIEAAFAGGPARPDGDRGSADQPREKILARLVELQRRDPPVEFQMSSADIWSNRVLVALLRRYGLTPYRYPRQRATTVMVKVSPSFAKEILVPQYERLAGALHSYLSEVTQRVVAEVLDADKSDAAIV